MTNKTGRKQDSGKVRGLSNNHTVNHGRARIKPTFLSSDSVIPAECAASQCVT